MVLVVVVVASCYFVALEIHFFVVLIIIVAVLLHHSYCAKVLDNLMLVQDIYHNLVLYIDEAIHVMVLY